MTEQVGRPAGVVPAQYLIAPRDDCVDDVVELREFSGGVEIGEAIQRLQGPVSVVGEVEAVEFLQRASRP